MSIQRKYFGQTSFGGQRRNPVSWFAKLWDGHTHYGFPKFLLKMSYIKMQFPMHIIHRLHQTAWMWYRSREFEQPDIPVSLSSPQRALHSFRMCPLSFRIVDPQVALSVIFLHYFKTCASKIRYNQVFIFHWQLYSTERDKDGQGINTKVGRFSNSKSLSKFH